MFLPKKDLVWNTNTLNDGKISNTFAADCSFSQDHENMNINNCKASVSSTEDCALACSENSECIAYFTLDKGDNSYRCCLYREVASPYKAMAQGLPGGTCGILESLFFRFKY